MQKKLNEDFIEEYSEKFAAKISDDFFATNAFINGQEILNITPSKQVNFFVIKLLFNNWQQESQRLESPFFDYSAPDVKEAMVQFMNVLSRHIKIGRKEFETLLQDAVRDTLFLVMAPNVFMEIEMDRRGTEELTEKTAKNILKYLRVSKDAFSDYLLSNVGIDRDEIALDDDIISEDTLLEEIGYLNEVVPVTLQKLEEGDDSADEEPGDEQAVTQQPEDEEAALLNVEPEDVFKPKVAEREREVMPEENEPEPSAAEETEELTEELEEELTAEAPIEASNEASTTEPTSSLVWEMPVHDIEEEEEEEDDIEEEKEESASDEEDEATDAPVAEVITNVAPEDEDDEEDEDNILNSKFEDPMIATSIAEAHENQVDSMMSAISLNQRFMFINELFDGDPEVFKQAIDKVDACNSFDESVELLVQLYAKEYHWDMNSEEVKELLKIIFRRFR